MSRTPMTNAETNNTAATGAERGAHVAPEKAPSEKGATRKKGAPKGQKTAERAKAKAAAAKKAAKAGKKAAPAKRASAPRAESKGATLAEIMKATEWQAHSVRGFISTAGKRQGIKIESAKSEAGERTYKVAK